MPPQIDQPAGPPGKGNRGGLGARIEDSDLEHPVLPAHGADLGTADLQCAPDGGTGTTAGADHRLEGQQNIVGQGVGIADSQSRPRNAAL